MTIVRKIVAAAVAAVALTVTTGAVEANAAPVKPAKIVVSPLGGGQGDWPFMR